MNDGGLCNLTLQLKGPNLTEIITIPFSIDIQTDEHVIYSQPVIFKFWTISLTAAS